MMMLDGLKIHLKTQGTGIPLLLLHGFGEDHSVWVDTYHHLINHYKVFLPDLPGSGASDFSEKVCGSIDEMARVMFKLMDDAQITEFIVLGHSMGGYIALAMADLQPQRIIGLGLIHSTAFADTLEKIETRRKAIHVIKEKGSYVFLKTSIPGLFSESFQNEHPAQVDSLVENGRNFLPNALISYYQAMITRSDRTNLLTNISVPVLFIVGEFDKAAPKIDILKQVPLAKQAALFILQKSAHMGMFEEKEIFQRAISQFLNNFF